MKKKLSIACKAAGSNIWIKFLPSIERDHNREFIKGTRYRRTRVDVDNFTDFLAEYLGLDSPEAVIAARNLSVLEPFKILTSWNKKIFKYSIGEKVFVSRRATHIASEPKKGSFLKTSVVGGFDPQLRKITGRRLVRSKLPSTLVPGTGFHKKMVFQYN